MIYGNKSLIISKFLFNIKIFLQQSRIVGCRKWRILHLHTFQMANLCWWYYISKLSEFADTVFFVMRKKDSQITLLHLYHHSLTPLETWILVKFLAGMCRHVAHAPPRISIQFPNRCRPFGVASMRTFRFDLLFEAEEGVEIVGPFAFHADHLSDFDALLRFWTCWTEQNEVQLPIANWGN